MIDTTPCPKCNTPSRLYDCIEVDIGVGPMRGQEEWECPTHGIFGHQSSPPFAPIFRDDPDQKDPPHAR